METFRTLIRTNPDFKKLLAEAKREEPSSNLVLWLGVGPARDGIIWIVEEDEEWTLKLYLGTSIGGNMEYEKFYRLPAAVLFKLNELRHESALRMQIAEMYQARFYPR